MTQQRAVTRAALAMADLHPALADPALERMNFLNEVAARFPEAVSFAAGRPCEDFFEPDDLPRYLTAFQDYLHSERGADASEVRRTLFQYGRTKGIIHELLAEHLEIDEDIVVDPESIVVTVGCQEAMVLALYALCGTPGDVVLATSPTYVGLTGAAKLLDREVWPVREAADGIDLDDLAEQLRAARAAGRRPRACYVVPDFANPSGVSMSLDARQRLLALAAEHDVLVLEDNPYGFFGLDDGARLPTLKALDRDCRVIYLGSLAKTCFPGARIGFAVADQRVSAAGSPPVFLADELGKAKSMLTVNTSPLAQALAGGKLLEHGCSLIKANARETAVYRRNMRRLLDGLERWVGEDRRVSWNRPRGGFFVVVAVPFDADSAALEHSARRHGVLWTPMRDFYDMNGGERQIRLSISALDSEQIDLGVDRLRALVEDLGA